MLLLAAWVSQEVALTQFQMMGPMIELISAMRQEELEAARRARVKAGEIADEAAQEGTFGR